MALLPVFIVGIVFGFVYLIVRISAHEKDQRRRIELVERALDSGAIDAQTKRELVETVANARAKAGPGAVFSLGWVGLFAGLGMIGTGLALEPYDWWPAGIMTTAISFGVLSIPLAARELQSRKHA